MRVFVTGGTGFVGQEVLRELYGAGHGIRILVRNPKSKRVEEVVSRFGAEVHPGDVTDAGSLNGAVVGMDAVIHLVGIISEVGTMTFEKVHTEGTRNMMAAARNQGVKRFIHMSALCTRAAAVSSHEDSIPRIRTTYSAICSL